MYCRLTFSTSGLPPLGFAGSNSGYIQSISRRSLSQHVVYNITLTVGGASIMSKLSRLSTVTHTSMSSKKERKGIADAGGVLWADIGFNEYLRALSIRIQDERQPENGVRQLTPALFPHLHIQRACCTPKHQTARPSWQEISRASRSFRTEGGQSNAVWLRRPG